MSNFISWIKSLFTKPIKEPVKPPVRPEKPNDKETPNSSPVTSPGKRPEDLPASNHYAGRKSAQLLAEYRYLFSIATITPKWHSEVWRSVDWAKLNRSRFEAVSRVTLVPWYVVAIINIMEMGTNFNGSLLNGDDWHGKTRNFPPGHGPWKSWEDAAIYAFDYEEDGWNIQTETYNWKDIGSIFWFLEAWNGFNARTGEQYEKTTPKGASPYIYSGTPFYVSGKKQENPTRFTPELVSQQIGCMAFLKALELSGERLV